MSPRHWKAGLTPQEFVKVRGDPRLPPLMALARVANALSLSHQPLMLPVDRQTPRARKHRTSAIFYAGAILFEGLRGAETLKAHFGALPQYREAFVPILRDPAVQSLRSTFLKPLRDQITFHFDAKVPATVLPDLDATAPVVFLFATEENASGTYFELADDLAIRYLMGNADTDVEAHARLETFLVGTTDLFKRFTIATQRLIPAALYDLGVRAL